VMGWQKLTEMETGGVVSYSCLTFWVGDNEESIGIT
jgi:hypothetical protein